jgi:hypothetical protein
LFSAQIIILHILHILVISSIVELMYIWADDMSSVSGFWFPRTALIQFFSFKKPSPTALHPLQREHTPVEGKKRMDNMERGCDLTLTLLSPCYVCMKEKK